MPTLHPIALHRFDPLRPELPPEWTCAPDVGGLALEERELYAAKSPYNVLNATLPDPSSPDGPRLKQWLAKGDLIPMAESMVLMAVRAEGEPQERYAVWCGMAADDPGLGVVERTIPAAEDRALARLRLLGAQAAPVLATATGLAATVADLAAECAEGPALASLTLGKSTCRFWQLSAAQAGQMAEAARHTPALLVDGQHRRAAMLRLESAGGQAANAIARRLWTCIAPREMVELETFHRVVTWYRKLDWEALLACAEKQFTVESLDCDPDQLAQQADGAIRVVLSSSCWRLTPKPDAAPDGCAIGTQVINDLFLQGVVGLDPNELTSADFIDVTTSASQAARLVADGLAQAALLVRPLGWSDVENAAAKGRLLPPQTIRAWPKPPYGLFYAVDG